MLNDETLNFKYVQNWLKTLISRSGTSTGAQVKLSQES